MEKAFKVGFIIEGTHDWDKLRYVLPLAFPVVIMRGKYNKHIKTQIQQAIKMCDVVFIFTDPDDFGNLSSERIKADFDLPRIEIQAEKCKHKAAYNKMKIGVEHCENDYLVEVLNKYFQLHGIEFQI